MRQAQSEKETFSLPSLRQQSLLLAWVGLEQVSKQVTALYSAEATQHRRRDGVRPAQRGTKQEYNRASFWLWDSTGISSTGLTTIAMGRYGSEFLHSQHLQHFSPLNEVIQLCRQKCTQIKSTCPMKYPTLLFSKSAQIAADEEYRVTYLKQS